MKVECCYPDHLAVVGGNDAIKLPDEQCSSIGTNWYSFGGETQNLLLFMTVPRLKSGNLDAMIPFHMIIQGKKGG